MKKTHDLVATVGEYQDKQSGEMKKRYVNCGVVLTDEETGRMSIKLETVPVSPEWSGWFSLFEPRDKDGNRPQGQQARQQPQQQAQPQQQQQQQQHQPHANQDDIPF